jgi:hypothetical protein
MFGLEVQSQDQGIFFKNNEWNHPSKNKKNKGRDQLRVNPVLSLVDTEPNTSLKPRHLRSPDQPHYTRTLADHSIVVAPYGDTHPLPAAVAVGIVPRPTRVFVS